MDQWWECVVNQGMWLIQFCALESQRKRESKKEVLYNKVISTVLGI